jgi:hypothetical protein
MNSKGKRSNVKQKSKSEDFKVNLETLLSMNLSKFSNLLVPLSTLIFIVTLKLVCAKVSLLSSMKTLNMQKEQFSKWTAWN